MKIAITGASGFIGRHVLAELLKQGEEIVAVTRGDTLPAELSRVVRTVEIDISRPTPNCFEQLGCPEILIHLAWDGLPNYKSLHHFETELPRQYHFLKIMVESGLSSLFVTGTCFEYGMQSGSLSEEMPAKPNNPYGYAKNALRLQLEFLKSVNPFSLTWARLFYMYGQGQSSTSLFTKLKEAMVRGEKVFNMSGGEQLRDYLPVEKIARHIVRLAILQRDIGVVNICSGEPISVRKLVEQWLHENNWKIELNLGYYPYPDYEPMEFWGDSSRIDSINAPK
jgi:nucleoside-diphosphate-sugar epimerase